jgi:uncharacterized membrane protein YoaK (UPF0700 family)
MSGISGDAVKVQTLGIGGMAFGSTLAWRSGAWLFTAVRTPEHRAGPFVAMTLMFVVGAAVAIWGARAYHELPLSESDAPTA